MTECLLKLCTHRIVGGAKCSAPALRQSDYCRHHTRVHRPAIIPAYVFEASTVREFQLALQRTINDLWTGRITPKLSGQILHELDKRIRVLKAQRSGSVATPP